MHIAFFFHHENFVENSRKREPHPAAARWDIVRMNLRAEHF